MTTTSAFVSKVKPDHTIDLPDSIPVGAKVAVVLLPADDADEETTTRDLRFQNVLDSIRSAINSDYTAPEISKIELDKLIKEARQASKA